MRKEDDKVNLDLRGGKRAGAGRKPIGETRIIALTMDDKDWVKFDQFRKRKTQAQALREIVSSYFGGDGVE